MAGDSNWASVVTLVHFDGANAGTTLHDSSLSNHTVTATNSAQLTTSFAAFGTASADFVTHHGSDPVITATNSADYQFGSGTFTIEGWVYPTAANNSYIIHTGLASASNKGWGLSYNSATPALTFGYSTAGTATTNISGTVTLTLNAWTHVAADYDGSTLRVYAGGSVVGSSTLSGGLFATTAALAIGNDNNTNVAPWAGYIDEIRVTKGVARYAGAYTPPTYAFPAYGTSPQPELGGAGSGNANNASITYNLTTWEPNDILVVAVFNENNATGNPATVASIVSSGLTFTRRSILSVTNAAGMEVWWALAATPLLGQSMTITFNSSFDDASSVAFGVAGCYTASPWDSNTSLAKSANTFTISGFSTSFADDCLVTFVGSASGPGNPAGFTVIAATSTVGGIQGSAITTGYETVSSAQSSITLSAATGTFAAFIADALTADVNSTDLYQNRMRFSTATTGTGTISLGSAVTEYQVVPLQSGLQIGYSIVDGNNWEVGTGIYTYGSPPTLTRATVEDSSTGPGVLMNLSGSATVSLVVTAAMFASYMTAALNDVGSNKIQNPLFNIAQRGTGAFTTGGYTLDRWYVSNLTDTISVTQVALADADRTAIGDEEAQYALQNVFTGNSGTAYNELFQRIENVRRLSNKTVTVSFWAKASTGTPNIGVSLDQNMGTGGSPSSSVFGNGVAIVLSTTWTRYSSTFTLGSLSGLTLGTNNDHSTQLNFWFSSGTTQATRAGGIGVQSATISLWGVQVEIGTIVTLLEKPDPRFDFDNCQRFYQIGNFSANGYTTTGIVASLPVLFPVPMRAAPSVSPSFTTQTNCGSSTTTGITANGFSPQTTGSALGAYVLIGSFTASADL